MKKTSYTINIVRKSHGKGSISLSLKEWGKCEEDTARMIINHLLPHVKRFQIH